MSADILPHTLLLATPALAAWFTAGLLAVLALRRPLRALAGPRCAYALWLLPLVAMLASLAAKLWPLAPLRWPALMQTVTVLAHAGSRTSAPVASLLPDWIGALLIGLWLFGSACALLVLLGRYAALRLALRVLPGDTLARHGVEGRHARLHIRRHPAGPALLWALRPLLLLPPDFERRFDATQRWQILHHELCHRAQGDAWWNLLAALLGALFWWHPLRRWAQRAFALDQELACDARLFTSRQRPSLRSYADTLLQAASTLPLPLGSGVSHPRQLKERIAMLAQPRASRARRSSAAALVLALLTGTAFAASHGMAPAPIPLTLGSPQSPVPVVGLTHDVPPRYPLDAVKKHEQGIVYLLILVGSEGHPLEIKQAMAPRTKPAQSLVAAAITAAAQWRFVPAQRDGKAVAAWVKVPIEFKLGDDADKLFKPAARS
ncbi:MAG: TonB family protein [Metallibacterium scheffleri]|jgi:TonB family protein|uniref:TonB family protein n=1 Tax=Metallibacterium scheffleri TaxID=993689 RepID=UPI0026F2F650|nr:TonB family protein [Metallibacterium scheffleri]MCK9366868.1 TonB family protein [Metallibacterium scheffleri]